MLTVAVVVVFVAVIRVVVAAASVVTVVVAAIIVVTFLLLFAVVAVSCSCARDVVVAAQLPSLCSTTVLFGGHCGIPLATRMQPRCYLWLRGVCMCPAQRGGQRWIWRVKEIRIVVDVWMAGRGHGGGIGSGNGRTRIAVWKLAGWVCRST